MIALPPSTRIWLACGTTDMRKGMCGLSLLVQEVLKQSPHSGAVFAFLGVAAIWSSHCGMTAKVCASVRSGSTEDGRITKVACWAHFRRELF